MMRGSPSAINGAADADADVEADVEADVDVLMQTLDELILFEERSKRTVVHGNTS